VGPGATSDTVRAVDMSRLHPLTGPVHIEGARPGDLLEVEILDVEPDTFGYTSQHEGFGFLREHFPDPFVVTWQLDGGRATSEQLPGVASRRMPSWGSGGRPGSGASRGGQGP
jgi:formamidase